MLFRSKHLHKS